MSVSSLTPWLSDFQTVRFSISSGCFLLLNLLLSFVQLCKEAWCVYLRLRLGRKSETHTFTQHPRTLALQVAVANLVVDWVPGALQERTGLLLTSAHQPGARRRLTEEKCT